MMSIIERFRGSEDLRFAFEAASQKFYEAELEFSDLVDDMEEFGFSELADEIEILLNTHISKVTRMLGSLDRVARDTFRGI